MQVLQNSFISLDTTFFRQKLEEIDRNMQILEIRSSHSFLVLDKPANLSFVEMQK
jgi:hypothetical protein